MSAIVAAMTAAREEYARTRNPEDAILLAWDLDDACKAIVRASNAAGAGRVVAMRLADCGCVEVMRGDGSARVDPFMSWKCDPRPGAWPRPFARGATP